MKHFLLFTMLALTLMNCKEGPSSGSNLNSQPLASQETTRKKLAPPSRVSLAHVYGSSKTTVTEQMNDLKHQIETQGMEHLRGELE